MVEHESYSVEQFNDSQLTRDESKALHEVIEALANTSAAVDEAEIFSSMADLHRKYAGLTYELWTTRGVKPVRLSTVIDSDAPALLHIRFMTRPPVRPFSDVITVTHSLIDNKNVGILLRE